MQEGEQGKIKQFSAKLIWDNGQQKRKCRGREFGEIDENTSERPSNERLHEAL
jgi:hypothetical protein